MSLTLSNGVGGRDEPMGRVPAIWDTGWSSLSSLEQMLISGIGFSVLRCGLLIRLRRVWVVRMPNLYSLKMYDRRWTPDPLVRSLPVPNSNHHGSREEISHFVEDFRKVCCIAPITLHILIKTPFGCNLLLKRFYLIWWSWSFHRYRGSWIVFSGTLCLYLQGQIIRNNTIPSMLKDNLKIEAQTFLVITYCENF